MPRPGPRPYECVKRAWHSDRHQPVRGSIIRQIFRLAMEAHSAATKKNKEWQEKLPLVVLKAEEIMYSKSNSEEEYTDADTMWNRVNDAIDTIIRRDESTETGPLLPPCVEGNLAFSSVNCLESLHYYVYFWCFFFGLWSAALNIGCIAERASRSQRHSNVRTYLSPKFQKPVSVSANEPHHQAEKSNKPSHTAQSPIPVEVLEDSNNRGAAFLHESMHVHKKPLARTLGASAAPAPINLGSVYPLYYGGNNQNQQVDLSLRVPETPIIIGMPISIKAPEERTKRFCDLSLRLGVSSDPPSTRIDVGSSRAYQGRNQEELCLFSEVKKKDSFSNYQRRHSDLRVKKHKPFCGDFL
ncbi:hypothetical protein HA466_0105780 [Hirschfeldia incana]|nr:hypothetical protein HA466_0105780 [Hirschfeldia incana]KAJ0254712.1 hypothetical protein HA466_0105780 [Hirschfeldia incana]